nr:MAG TPA: hypothetical protein [Caudoviricetes sp.]
MHFFVQWTKVTNCKQKPPRCWRTRAAGTLKSTMDSP